MYGFLIGITTLVSTILGEKIVKEKKLISNNDYWNVILIVFVSALVGGRLYHVLDYWEYYSNYPYKIIAVWEGGMGIFGAILATLLAIYLYSKAKKQNFYLYTDLIIIFVPLIQIAGRVGNFFNKELFGKPTTLPSGIFIPLENRPTEYQTFEYFHPLFFYEFFFMAILFFYFSNTVFIKKTEVIGKGLLTALFFVFYGFVRIVLEPFRITGGSFYFFNLNLSYLISFGIVIIGMYMLIKSKKLIN